MFLLNLESIGEKPFVYIGGLARTQWLARYFRVWVEQVWHCDKWLVKVFLEHAEIFSRITTAIRRANPIFP